MWSSLWSILVCKIPQFWEKLPIRSTHHTFLESRQPEVTKIPYYVLSPEGSQKKVSTHGLILQRWILTLLVFTRFLLTTMKPTNFWSVLRVKWQFARKYFQCFTASMIAQASFQLTNVLIQTINNSQKKFSCSDVKLLPEQYLRHRFLTERARFN